MGGIRSAVRKVHKARQPYCRHPVQLAKMAPERGPDRATCGVCGMRLVVQFKPRADVAVSAEVGSAAEQPGDGC